MRSANTFTAAGEGDVLVFMPGGFEISQTIEAIRHTDEAKGFILLPLHGELPPNDQDAAVARYDKRKVVVATNVAETSLTIDGVRLVIDSGLARIAALRPESRHQHAAHRKDFAVERRPARGPRGPHRAGRVHAALVARGTRASRRRRNCRKSSGSICRKSC